MRERYPFFIVNESPTVGEAGEDKPRRALVKFGNWGIIGAMANNAPRGIPELEAI